MGSFFSDRSDQGRYVLFLVRIMEEGSFFGEEEHRRVFLGQETGDELSICVDGRDDMFFCDEFVCEVPEEGDGGSGRVHGQEHGVDAVQGRMVLVPCGERLHAVGAFRVEEQEQGLFTRFEVFG